MIIVYLVFFTLWWVSPCRSWTVCRLISPHLLYRHKSSCGRPLLFEPRPRCHQTASSTLETVIRSVSEEVVKSERETRVSELNGGVFTGYDGWARGVTDTELDTEEALFIEVVVLCRTHLRTCCWAQIWQIAERLASAIRRFSGERRARLEREYGVSVATQLTKYTLTMAEREGERETQTSAAVLQMLYFATNLTASVNMIEGVPRKLLVDKSFAALISLSLDLADDLESVSASLSAARVVSLRAPLSPSAVQRARDVLQASYRRLLQVSLSPLPQGTERDRESEREATELALSRFQCVRQCVLDLMALNAVTAVSPPLSSDGLSLLFTDVPLSPPLTRYMPWDRAQSVSRAVEDAVLSMTRAAFDSAMEQRSPPVRRLDLLIRMHQCLPGGDRWAERRFVQILRDHWLPGAMALASVTPSLSIGDAAAFTDVTLQSLIVAQYFEQSLLDTLLSPSLYKKRETERKERGSARRGTEQVSERQKERERVRARLYLHTMLVRSLLGYIEGQAPPSLLVHVVHSLRKAFDCLSLSFTDSEGERETEWRDTNRVVLLRDTRRALFAAAQSLSESERERQRDTARDLVAMYVIQCLSLPRSALQSILDAPSLSKTQSANVWVPRHMREREKPESIWNQTNRAIQTLGVSLEDLRTRLSVSLSPPQDTIAAPSVRAVSYLLLNESLSPAASLSSPEYLVAALRLRTSLSALPLSTEEAVTAMKQIEGLSLSHSLTLSPPEREGDRVDDFDDDLDSEGERETYDEGLSEESSSRDCDLLVEAWSLMWDNSIRQPNGDSGRTWLLDALSLNLTNTVRAAVSALVRERKVTQSVRLLERWKSQAVASVCHSVSDEAERDRDTLRVLQACYCGGLSRSGQVADAQTQALARTLSRTLDALGTDYSDFAPLACAAVPLLRPLLAAQLFERESLDAMPRLSVADTDRRTHWFRHAWAHSTLSFIATLTRFHRPTVSAMGEREVKQLCKALAGVLRYSRSLYRATQAVQSVQSLWSTLSVTVSPAQCTSTCAVLHGLQQMIEERLKKSSLGNADLVHAIKLLVNAAAALNVRYDQLLVEGVLDERATVSPRKRDAFAMLISPTVSRMSPAAVQRELIGKLEAIQAPMTKFAYFSG